MNFEVSFSKSQKELAELLMLIERAGEGLEELEKTGRTTNSRYQKDLEKTARRLDAFQQKFAQLTKETEAAGRAAGKVAKQYEAFLSGIASGNTKALAEINALKDSTSQLGQVIREKLANETYSKWLKKTASESANLRGENEHLRASLDHLDNPQRRVNLRLQAMKDHLDRTTVAGQKQALQTKELQQQLKRQATELGMLNATYKERIKGVNQANTAEERQRNQISELVRQYDSLHGGLGEQIARQKELNKQRTQDITLTQRQANQKSELDRRLRSLVDGEERQIAILKERTREQRRAVTADERREAQTRELRRELKYLQSAEGRAHAALQQRVAAERNALQSRHANNAAMRNGNQLTASMRAGLAGLNTSFGMYTSSTIVAASATYAFAAALRDTLDVGMLFTESMSRAEAIMYSSSDAVMASSEQMKALETQVRALGQSTVFTATQVSGGLIDLGMAGLSGGEALTALKPSLDLASIGMIEMSEAADIATNVMTAFKKDASDLPDVVNVMATAVTSSNTNIQQLANSLSYVGPAAQSAGFGMRDTVAAIELLASSGIKGSKAGTGLRRTMLNLLNPTAKGAKVLDDYNISILKADGSTRDLTDIMGQFSEALYNDAITPAQRTAAIVDLVGVRAQSAFARMASSAGELTVLREQLDNVAGAAERMREKIEDNLTADWKQVKSAFEEIELSVFEDFESQLRAVSAATTVWLHSLNEAADVIGKFDKVDGFEVMGPQGEMVDVTQLDVLIARLEIAAEAAGIFLGAWAGNKVLSVTSKNLSYFSSDLTAWSDKAKAAATAQRSYTAALQASNGPMAASTMQMRAMALASTASAKALNFASVAVHRLAVAGSVLSKAFGWVGLIWGVYQGLQMAFGSSVADKITDQKERVQEAEEAYKGYQKQIEETQNQLNREALGERQKTLAKNIEASNDRLEEQRKLLERLSEANRKAGDSSSYYDERIKAVNTRIRSLSGQSSEARKELESVREALGQLGSSASDIGTLQERMDSYASTLNYVDTRMAQNQKTIDTLEGSYRTSAPAMRTLTDRSAELEVIQHALTFALGGTNDQLEELERLSIGATEQIDALLKTLDQDFRREQSFEELSNAQKRLVIEQKIREARADAINVDARLMEGIIDPQQAQNDLAEIEQSVEDLHNQRTELDQQQLEAEENRDAAHQQWLARNRTEQEQVAHLRDRQEELTAAIERQESLERSGDPLYDAEKHTELLKERNQVAGEFESITQRNNRATQGYSEELEKQRQTLAAIDDLYSNYENHVAGQQEVLEIQRATSQLLYDDNLSLSERARLTEVALTAQNSLHRSLERAAERGQEIRDIEERVVELKERAKGLTGEDRKDAEDAVNKALGRQKDLVSDQLGEYQTLLDATAQRTKELNDQADSLKADREIIEIINKAAEAGQMLDDQAAERTLELRKRRQEYKKVNAQIEAFESALASANAEDREGIKDNLEGAQQKKQSLIDVIDLLGREEAELSSNAEALRAQAESVSSFFDDIGSSVTDTMADGFDDVEGLFDSIEDSFEDMLANLIREAWVNPILLRFENSVKGAMGLEGSGGQQGGMSANGMGNAGDIVQYGKKGYDYFFGGGPSASAGSAPVGYGSGFGSQVSTGGYSGWAGNASGAAGSQSSWMSAAGSNAMTGVYTAGASYAGGWAGGEAAGMFTDKQANSNIGQQVGTTAGAIIGSVAPGIGTAIGAGIGSFLGSAADTLFGSYTPFEGRFGTTGSIDASAEGGGKDGVFEHQDDEDRFYGQSALGYTGFRDEGTQRLQKAGTGNKDWAEELTNAAVKMDNLVASIAQSPAEIKAMQDAVQGLERSSGNAGDIIDFALKERPRAALEQLGGDFGAFVNDLDGGIEQVVQQAQVAQQAHELLSNGMARLNLQFDAAGASAYEAAGDLAQYAGGLENINSVNQAYYQAAFTENERLSNSQSDLLSSLSGVTDETPRTVAELRAMVEAQNLNSEAGQQLAYDLMQLAPALKETNTAVRQAIDQQYQDELGRAQAGDGLDYWFNQVASGALTLEEALWNVANSMEGAIQDVYQSHLGREGDAEGVQYWIGHVESGALTLEEALWHIATSAEATQHAANDAAGGLDSIRDGVESAFGDLESLVKAEQQAISDAHNQRIRGIDEEIRAVESGISETEDVAKSLKSALDSMQSDALYDQLLQRKNAQAQITTALAMARMTGNVSMSGDLEDALRVVSEPSEQLFGSFRAYQRDFYRTANEIAALEELTDEQLTTEDMQLNELQRQREQWERQHSAEMERYDDILSNAEAQVDALLGINDGVDSIPAALAALEEAMGGSSSGGGSSDGGGSSGGADVESTIRRAYSRILQSSISDDDIDYWSGVGLTGDDLARAIAHTGYREGNRHAQTWWDENSEREDLPGFKNGGIADGPMSGYPVELHGKELITPLNNGPIPFEIRGGNDGNPMLDELRKQTRKLETMERELDELRNINVAIVEHNAKLARETERMRRQAEQPETA